MKFATRTVLKLTNFFPSIWGDHITVAQSAARDEHEYIAALEHLGECGNGRAAGILSRLHQGEELPFRSGISLQFIPNADKAFYWTSMAHRLMPQNTGVKISLGRFYCEGYVTPVDKLRGLSLLAEACKDTVTQLANERNANGLVVEDIVHVGTLMGHLMMATVSLNKHAQSFVVGDNANMVTEVRVSAPSHPLPPTYH